MLGHVRMLLEILGGSWAMLEGVQGMLGAAKLPIVAPGTAWAQPKPHKVQCHHSPSLMWGLMPHLSCLSFAEGVGSALGVC